MYNNLEYDIRRDGKERTLYINAKNYQTVATIEDDQNIMEYVLNILSSDPLIDTIIIDQDELISYYDNSIKVLKGFLDVYYLIKDNIANYYQYLLSSNPLYQEIRRIINLLDKEYLKDPIGVYVYVNRFKRKLLSILKKNPDLEKDINNIISFIDKFLIKFESLYFFRYIKPFLIGYEIGNRDIYKRLLMGDIKPKFIDTKYMNKIEDDYNVLESYKIDKFTEVFILKNPEESIFRYYIFPEEYKIFSEETFLSHKAMDILLQYEPKREDYLDTDRLRDIYINTLNNILSKLSSLYNIKLEKDRYEMLKNLILRYTIGFGIVEKIVIDQRIEDLFINPPSGISPVSLQHSDYQMCITNVIPTRKEIESWATKLRLISGRPFDEANPVLDTDLSIGNEILLRVAAISPPLSPTGISYIFRRHRDKPWTLPLFIDNKMLNYLSAGLLSFLVNNGRTILIAGTRGSGKTSLLTALMLEIPRKIRLITVEDTLEIPSDYFIKIGYNIVPLKVKSPFSLKSAELSADEGLRVSLRMGDSAIIVGEVRSKEAQTLYEAMRIGATANAVMGTLHAESPYGVYDRVVNDLGVPKTSFKATDIIVIVNPIKDPSGMKRYRRVLKISEVRKQWENDPLKEKGFVDLMSYDAEKDDLVPSLELLNGDSDILKSVASRVTFLSKSWERIWNMIEAIGLSKKLLVDISKEKNRKDILEADFVVRYNEVFYNFVSKSLEEYNEIVKEYILDNIKKWTYQKLK
ncbi:flagella-related ATPase FlaI [Nanobdella aerobiophila]|uniref:Flagella-related ATPase FlaI n=1 Tax=Nanobdella aerobiophila TaxID=2586965 RepID=A0A915T038_9ARCH|nr:type II/IV secretion system ATPase subunit [Nanobdella aerobiophila]BBL45664.1 flagella-related ATPase FlaI [Nanobdella aerobiophila]